MLEEEREINVDLIEEQNIETSIDPFADISKISEAENMRIINETNRISNESEREKYLNNLKAAIEAGEFDGKVQYTAGDGIHISEDNVISADGTTDYGDLDNKPRINDVELSGNKTLDDLGIQAIDNLEKYYLKTEVYNQEQVNALIDAVNSFNVSVVQALPAENIDTHTIYLVPKESEENDNYDEYIYILDSWEHIGSTDIDLTNYVEKEDGKGLSSNDYTDDEKLKLANLEHMVEFGFKVADTLPVGSVVGFDGDTVPSGWEEVEETVDYSNQITLESDVTIIADRCRIIKKDNRVVMNIQIGVSLSAANTNKKVFSLPSDIIPIVACGGGASGDNPSYNQNFVCGYTINSVGDVYVHSANRDTTRISITAAWDL